MEIRDHILRRVTDQYLPTDDFNGLPGSELLARDWGTRVHGCIRGTDSRAANQPEFRQLPSEPPHQSIPRALCSEFSLAIGRLAKRTRPGALFTQAGC